MCSRARALELLGTVNNAELAEMIAEGSAEIRCHFCNDVYVLTLADLEAEKNRRHLS